MPTSFLHSYAFLAVSHGLALLHVNFRGSTGFGADALASLPGRIGTQDVSDVLQATQVKKQRPPATHRGCGRRLAQLRAWLVCLAGGGGS